MPALYGGVISSDTSPHLVSYPCKHVQQVCVCVCYRINPTDEEGKSRTAEKMTELVQEAHQAHTKKALNGLKVPPPPLSIPGMFTARIQMAYHAKH